MRKFFGLRKKLTYEERVKWFMDNFYESGMHNVNGYKNMLNNMKDYDLDNFTWDGEFIKFPKYRDEIKNK